MLISRNIVHFVVALVAGMPFASTAAPMAPTGYRIESVKVPDDITLEVGGLAFAPNGDLYIVTRFGQVWIYRQKDGKESWKLFADGLHQPLGIVVTPESRIFVAQRPELTELIDTDRNDKADVYRTVCDAWGYSGNYHEFAFGPVRDSKGNFYISLNLSAGGGDRVEESQMGAGAPWRGWCVKVTPDGKMIPFASGLRSPAGIGIDADDQVYITDNQGDWVSTSCMFHIEEGKFYGHPASLKFRDDFKGKDLNKVGPEGFAKVRTLPVVWFPHMELARSPGDPVFDDTTGKFGPFTGQAFVGDQGESNVVRVSLEMVNGLQQGCAIEFAHGLKSGAIRATFAPDGTTLYIGQTGRGWGTKGGEPFALQRIVYDGKTVPHEIETIRATPTGFRVVFTTPVDAKVASEPANYGVRYWDYKYQPAYIREQKRGVTTIQATAAKVMEDGKSVELTIGDLKAPRVYEITAGIPSADGTKPSTGVGFYTLNQLKTN